MIKMVTCYGNISFPFCVCVCFHGVEKKKKKNHAQCTVYLLKMWGSCEQKKKNSGRAEKEAKSRRQTEETIVRARSRGLACSETLPNLMTPLWHQTSHFAAENCPHNEK